ncbi:sugar ABC transporter substrate-binding protein [Spirochaetia bacterium]|nr:sugar ABC transporter substrate-binding protein [Spirochaetia bacterium]
MGKETIIKRIRQGLAAFIPKPAGNAGSITGTRLGKFFSKARSISADKVLWIWALLMVAGFFLFRLLSGNLPGMATTLVFAQYWENQLESQTLTKLAAEFEEQNPGIVIKLETMSWDDIRLSLEGKEKPGDDSGRRSSQPPDIFSIDPYGLYAITPYLTAGGEESNVLALISFINPLFYNIDLLQAAGFDRPPKNQTELLSYVQRINQTAGAGQTGSVYGAGIALGGGDPRLSSKEEPHNVSRHLLSWIWSAAGNSETGSFNFTTPEVVTALNFLNQLKQYLYPNPFALTQTELLRAFGEGRVGMMIGSSADIRELKTKGVNFGITTIPGPESYTKRPVFPLTVWYAGINGKSEYQEAARKFLDFLRERAGNLAAAAYAVPGNGRRSRDMSKNDLFYAKAFDMYEAGEMARELYDKPGVTELNSIIRREVELMFNGTKTPQQCAEAIQQDWEEVRLSS